MATVNFYLDKPDRFGRFQIRMIYQHQGKKFKIFTKEKTEKKAWNYDKQRVKRNYPGSIEINRNLDEMESLLLKIVRDASFKSIAPLPSYVKERFYKEIQGDEESKENKPPELKTEFQTFIDASSTLKSYNTIRSYKSTLQKIKDFEKKTRRKVSFDSIDLEFYEKFRKYLISECKLLNNSIGKHIKILKTFLNYAVEKGSNQNLAFKKFKVSTEQVDIIYLTEEELLHLHTLELDSKRLRNVRDIFCLACFTGLRFSDLNKIKTENIADGILTLRTEKTKDILTIPLNDYSIEIIDRHTSNGNIHLPHVITNQKMNEYLKELGEVAEFDDWVEQHRYSGSKKITNKTEKYNLITTHTARRTFVTLALEKGFRPEVVMEMTGHKNYATFKRYIKITSKVKKEEMNRLWSKEK